MGTEILQRLNREMISIYALIVINIAGAGLAMSFGIAVVINNLFPMMTELRIQLLGAALTGLGLVGFGFAISWLVSSAEVFSDFDDLRDEFKKRHGDADSDEVAHLIVQNMALYRENRPKINRLMLGSRATGIFFLLSALIGIFNLLTGLPNEIWRILVALTGVLTNITISAVGLSCPYFFNRYTRTWEQRLKDSVEAEKKLNRILEGC